MLGRLLDTYPSSTENKDRQCDNVEGNSEFLFAFTLWPFCSLMVFFQLLFLYVYVLSALVFALPLAPAKTKATPDQEVRIVRNEYEDFGDGAYRF